MERSEGRRKGRAMIKSKREKEISLTLRGFDVSPQKVETLIGRPATRSGVKGFPAKPGVNALLSRSFVKYSLGIPDSLRINEAIVALLEQVGGLSNVERVCEAVRPEFVEVNLYLPVRDSEEQEGGLITAEVLKLLARLGCSLSLEL
jgi:hypothetical protein